MRSVLLSGNDRTAEEPEPAGSLHHFTRTGLTAPKPQLRSASPAPFAFVSGVRQ